MIQLHYQQWQAAIDPEHGMNTVSLTWKDEHILRNPAGQPEPGASCLHGTPLLLPPNRTADGRFDYEGQAYQLPINEEERNNHLHGYLRFQSFAVTEQSESLVAAEYENKGEIFPFPFKVSLRYHLDGQGYHQHITVENTGSKNMPLTFGIHTNFEEKDYFRVPLDRHCAVDSRYLPTGVLEPLSERQQQFRDGMAPDGGNVDGFYLSGGNVARIGKMEYTVSPNFTHWILYNKWGGQGFVCIEPQCGGVNCLNSGQGLRHLAPGQKETFHTCIGPAL